MKAYWVCIYEKIEKLGHDGIDFSGVIKLLQNKLK